LVEPEPVTTTQPSSTIAADRNQLCTRGRACGTNHSHGQSIQFHQWAINRSLTRVRIEPRSRRRMGEEEYWS